MRKTALLMLCSMGLFGYLQAQDAFRSVIASEGGTANTASLRLDWTLGEPVVESVVIADHMFTQGFQQPYLDVQEVHPDGGVVKARESGQATLNTDVEVRPNPVSAQLMVEFSQPGAGNRDILISDQTGKLVRKYDVAQGTTILEIDVSELIPGMYMLAVYNEHHEQLGIFQVVKID